MLAVVTCAAAAVFAGGTLQRSWLAAPWLVWLGKRSYAVYLWNCLIAATLVWTPMAWPVRTVLVVVPSLLLAELSWRLVESRFLTRQTRLNRSSVTDPRPASVKMQPMPIRSSVVALDVVDEKLGSGS